MCQMSELVKATRLTLLSSLLAFMQVHTCTRQAIIDSAVFPPFHLFRYVSIFQNWIQKFMLQHPNFNSTLFDDSVF